MLVASNAIEQVYVVNVTTSAHVIQTTFTSFMGCFSVWSCIFSTNKHHSDGNEPRIKPTAATILRFSAAATDTGAFLQLPSAELMVWLDFFSGNSKHTFAS